MPFNIGTIAHRTRYAGFAFCLFGFGCGAAPQSTGGSDPAPADPSAANTTHEANTAQGGTATPIYTTSLGVDHVINFYEFGEGNPAATEVYSMDSGDQGFLKTHGPFHSLTEIYKALNPGSQEVPAAILEVDARDALIPAAARAAAFATLNQPEAHVSALGQELQTAATGCSSDELGDSWGASWFVTNFCNASTTHNFCSTNQGAVEWDDYSSSFVTWEQMEGDFNLPGLTQRSHLNCTWAWWLQQWQCPFITGSPFVAQAGLTIDFNQPLAPRHLINIVSKPAVAGYLRGSSQCNHAHNAIGWD
jgi:hypothetical protein